MSSHGPPLNSPNRSMNMPNAARKGAKDGPGMWMPAGATGGSRRTPRAMGAAVANRYTVQVT